MIKRKTLSIIFNNLTSEKQHDLTAKEPEQRVAHIPPIVAPGPDDGAVNKKDDK